MNELKIFENEQFGVIRTAGTSEQPKFCLADVCRVLDLQVTPTKNRLNQDGVSLIKVTDALGREQEATFVNEQNLYKVIMRSDKPQAEPFQDWVCGEVLPSIRKSGGYMVAKEQDTPEDIMARALKIADETLKRKEQRLKELESKVEADAPKVLFANAVVGSKSSCLIGELAKVITQNGYKIGQNRLFEWMRQHGYLGTVGERRNIPNQKYIEQGLFELKKGVRTADDGVLVSTITTKVSGKGQAYFINKFLGQQV